MTEKMVNIPIRFILNASYEHELDIMNEQIVEILPNEHKPLENGQYYYLKYKGEKIIRKVYLAENGLMLVRVNPDYPSEYFDFSEENTDELIILGRIGLKPDFTSKK